jgi:fructose 1,6-bisphosphate aldolase/phosphatase
VHKENPCSCIEEKESIMKITLTAVRVDLGAVGGHLQPSEQLVSAVRASVEEKTDSFLIDCWINFTGDDLTILCTHENGVDSPKIHEILWDAFEKGAATAGAQGLYGVGQDIRDAGVTGAAKGVGPALAEMSFEERPNEAFLIFSIDKAMPGAFNLPFYLAFADPMHPRAHSFSTDAAGVPVGDHGCALQGI